MPDKHELAMYFKKVVEDAEDKHKAADEFIIDVLEYEEGWDELIDEYRKVIEERE